MGEGTADETQMQWNEGEKEGLGEDMEWEKNRNRLNSQIEMFPSVSLTKTEGRKCDENE